MKLVKRSSSDKYFTIDLYMRNGNIVEFKIPKAANAKDLINIVLRENGHGHCKNCKNPIHENLLFSVNRHGQGGFMDQEDALYLHAKAKCKFFWLDQNKRVITIFFPDESVESLPVNLNIKARELPLFYPFKEKLSLLGISNSDMYYKAARSSDEVLVSPDDSPMKFFYNEKGEQVNESGKLFFRNNTFTPTAEDWEEKNMLNVAKERARHKTIAKATEKLLEKNSLKQVNKGEENSVHVSSTLSDKLMRTQSVNFLNDDDSSDITTCRPSLGVELSIDTLTKINENELDEKTEEINSFLDSSSQYMDNNIITNRNSMNNVSSDLGNENEISDVIEENGRYLPCELNGENNEASEEVQPHPDGVSESYDDEIRRVNSNSYCIDEKTTVNEKVSPRATKSVKNREELLIDEVHEGSEQNLNETSSENQHRDDVNVINVSLTSKKTLEEGELKVLKCRLCEQLQVHPECISSLQRLKEIQANIHKNRTDTRVDNNTDDQNNNNGKRISQESDSVSVDQETEQDNVTTEQLYICLSGVHLKRRNDNWVTTDGSTIGRYNAQSFLNTKDKCIDIGENILCFYEALPTMKRFRWQVKSRNAVKSDDDSLCDSVTPLPTNVDNTFSSFPDNADDDEDIDIEEEFILDRPETKRYSSRFISFPNLTTNMKEKFVSVKHDLKSKATLIDSKIQKSLKDSSLSENVKSRFDFIREEIKVKTLAINSNDSNSTMETAEIDIIRFNTTYIEPLKHALCLLAQEFDVLGKKVADDRFCRQIGDIVRRDVCGALANLLCDGLVSDDSFFRGLFTKTEPLSLWSLMKDFSRSFELEEFYCEETIIKMIENSIYLTNDDMKFRYYICDLISRVDSKGNKFLVTWFQLFAQNTSKLKKYYNFDSFWRCQSSEYFHVFFNENILQILRELNKWTFNLHMEFEHAHKSYCSSGSNKIIDSKIADEFAEVYMFE